MRYRKPLNPKRQVAHIRCNMGGLPLCVDDRFPPSGETTHNDADAASSTHVAAPGNRQSARPTRRASNIGATSCELTIASSQRTVATAGIESSATLPIFNAVSDQTNPVWILSRRLLIVAVCFIATACSFGGEKKSPIVCAPENRSELTTDDLTPFVSSKPFEVGSGEEAWVKVSDTDYNPSVIFSRVATVYLIEAGSQKQIREDTTGLILSDDPVIKFDMEREWQPVTTEVGTYEIYSHGYPTVEVVACPTGTED